MKISELSGALLDYWVAKAEGFTVKLLENAGPPGHAVVVKLVSGTHFHGFYKPSTDWAQAGPIIERENITLIPSSVGGAEGKWSAEVGIFDHYIDDGLPGLSGRGRTGPTPLVAAMRAFVAGKYGDQVPDLPA